MFQFVCISKKSPYYFTSCKFKVSWVVREVGWGGGYTSCLHSTGVLCLLYLNRYSFFFNVTATNRLKIFPIILKLVNYAVIMCLF